MDVQNAGLNPRLHYRKSGRQSGLCEPSIGACSGLTAQEYLEYYNDVRTSSFGARGYLGAWEHYLTAGKNESRCPIDNIFDPTQYLLANPDLMEAFEVRANTPTDEQLQRAKIHFCENFVNGSVDAATNTRRTEQRALVPGGRKFKFDADAYFAANPDVRAAGATAQPHLCTSGINEKRLLK